MRLVVEAMDSVLVEFEADGRVRFEHEEWTTPSLQEARAIIYAARNQIAELTELIEALDARRS